MQSETTQCPACPTCGEPMKAPPLGRTGVLSCPSCRTTRPLGWTSDPLPPPPTRDGDKGAPAMGDADNETRLRHFAEAIAMETDTEEHRCRVCEDSYSCPSELEPTPLCNLCAQQVAERLPGLLATLDAWKARAEAAEKDAARLNFLNDAVVNVIELDDGRLIDVRGLAVRPAIDKAMAEAAKKGRVQP